MAALAMSSWAIAADPTTPSVTPDEALSRLKTGNERFANSKVSAGKPVAERRAETAQSQHPFAIVVACAIRGQCPKSFSIKISGISSSFALPAIWWTTMHWGASSTRWSNLGTRLIVVLGHERCGAVTAAAQLLAISIRWCVIFNRPWLRAKEKRATGWPTLFMKMTLPSRRKFESRLSSVNLPRRFG